MTDELHQALAAAHDRVRCESCLGLGYRGGWRSRRNGVKVWKINTCRGCGGRGDRPATDRQSPRPARKRF